VLVAHDGRGRLQHPHPVHLQPSQDATHRGPAKTCLLRDPHTRPALAAKHRHTLDLFDRCHRTQPLRPRTAVTQSLHTACAISPNPLAHRLPAEPALFSPKALDHAPSHGHDGDSPSDLRSSACSHNQLLRSRSDGQQPIETSHVKPGPYCFLDARVKACAQTCLLLSDNS